MLPDLTDQFIDENYSGLIHTSNNPVTTSTLLPMYDGVGNQLPIKVSNTKVQLSNYVYPLSGGGVGNIMSLGNSNSIEFKAIADVSYPIGSVYLSVLPTNPTSLFGGSWNQISRGRVLVGVGSGVDVNSTGRTFGVRDDAQGEYTHTQTVSELAQHGHDIFISRSSQSDDNAGAQADIGTSFRNIQAVNKTANGLTALDTGNSQPMNVTQPSFGVYIWERTA